VGRVAVGRQLRLPVKAEMIATANELDRFFAKVVLPPDPTDCWEWIGATTYTGYGLIRWRGARGPGRAPRIAYELFKGTIPVGLEIDHLCNRPRCVNPTHLQVISHRENTLRSGNPCAVNARKQHCRRGHEFTLENTGRNAGGPHTRRCKACSRWRAQCRLSPTI
jgi:hypothetical protein